MKKLTALFLSLLLVLTMTAALAETDITLWTFPIGDWGNSEKVDEMLAAFNAVHPDIKVTVEYLDYTNGDAQITTAIEAKTTPDIVMEGPERLVANWAAAGKMLPLNDLWTDETIADINANNASVVATCQGADGNYYMYPLCMTAHCMVINKTAFEAADAMQYIDQETHTWTTEGFENALRALVNAGYFPTGLIYCSGQGGDQGTRALVTNLYDGRFTNGTSQMAFCWNAAQVANNKDKLADGIELFPMAFPSEDGVPRLDGGVWGFGLFDNGDDEKVAAAKEFIRFICDDETQVRNSVYNTGYFSVRASVTDLYTGTEKAANADYAMFVQYLGDIYQVTTNWTTQRYEWWNLLQRIGDGGNVADEVATYIKNVNL